MNEWRRGVLPSLVLFACALFPVAQATDIPVRVQPAAIPFGKPAELDVSVSDTHDARVTLAPSGPYAYFRRPLAGGAFDIAAVDNSLIIVGSAGLLALNRRSSQGDPEFTTLLPGIDGRILRLHGDHAYVMDADDELHVIDIASERPRVQGSYRSAAPVTDLAVSDGRAYLLSADRRLAVLDVRRPADIREIDSHTLEQAAERVLVDRDLLYIAVDDGLVIAAIDDARGLIPTGRYIHGGPVAVLALRGDHLYLGGERGLTVIDVSDPAIPRWVASHHRVGEITDMVIDGEDALVRDRSGALTLIDIAMPAMPTIIAGYAPIESDGALLLQDRLAITGTAAGIAAIDFSLLPPALSNELLDIGEGVNYGGQRRAFIDDGIAYVADWFSGIHIYDVADGRRPRLLSSFPTPGSPKGIVVKNGIAYVADDDHGLQVIDVHDPRRPRQVTNLPVNGLVYTPVIAADRLYLASHRGGFQIVDISDPVRPRLLSETDTPGKAWSVAVQDGIAYIADDDNGLLVYDVRRAEQPVLIGSFDPGGRVEEILVRGRHAYAAFFDDGLYVLDISRPDRPQQLAHIATPGNARGLDLTGDLLLVADWLAGVHVVDVTDPADARIIGSYDTDGAAWGVRAAGNDIACVLDWWGGFVTLDISDPARPALAARYNGRGMVRQLAAREGFLFAVRDSGLQIFDIANPLNPTWITGVEFDTVPSRLALSDDTAFVALQGGDIVAVDIRNPFAARPVHRFRHRGDVRKMQAAGPVLYILDRQSELTLFDIAPRDRPRELARLPGRVKDFAVAADHLAVAGTGNEILLYDVLRPAQPRLIQRIALAGSVPSSTKAEPDGIAAAGHMLAAVIPDHGIAVITGDGAAPEPTGFYHWRGTVHDIGLTDGVLLASIGEHDLMTVDVSRPDRPALQSIYTLLNPAGEFALHRGVAYFSGGESIVALQLLPEIPVEHQDAGRYRLALPGDLPLGTYDLLVTRGDGMVERQRGAVQVVMPGFSKPEFTMEDLEKALEQRGAGAR